VNPLARSKAPRFTVLDEIITALGVLASIGDGGHFLRADTAIEHRPPTFSATYVGVTPGPYDRQAFLPCARMTAGDRE